MSTQEKLLHSQFFFIAQSEAVALSEITLYLLLSALYLLSVPSTVQNVSLPTK